MTDTHPRPANTIRIGRHPDNDIALRDLDVSRHHAELRRNPDGSFEIIDLGSHGGTYVNGERITHKLLTEQDIIGIGEDRTFRLDRIADARTLPGSFEPPAGVAVPASGDGADSGDGRADPGLASG